jgi:hypothetical protein
MYAFIDETGNTGAALFDAAQPIFATAALLTRTDFDAISSNPIKKLGQTIGVIELHASELGVAPIEEIARGLHRVLKKADPQFFIARVEKKYLLATKMFDLLFDPGENRAASPHIYNIRPLRISFAFKFASIVSEEMAKDFWTAMMETSPERARLGMVRFCDQVLELVPTIVDVGLRERIGPAISWARENPEAIYFHSDGKVARHGHLPNLVGFGNLMDGIERQSERWKKPVRRIRHDRQSQFEGALKWWHELYANASPERVPLMMGEMFKAQRAGGSVLEISSADASAGIQVVDVILWLFNRLNRQLDIGPESAELMRWVFRRSMQNDFSFKGVLQALDQQFGWMFEQEPPPEQIEKAKQLLGEIEQARLDRVDEYAALQITEQ